MRNPDKETKKEFGKMSAIFYKQALTPSRSNRAQNISAHWASVTIPANTQAGKEFVIRHTLNRIPSSFFITEGEGGLIRSGVWTRTTIAVRTTRDFTQQTTIKIMIV